MLSGQTEAKECHGVFVVTDQFVKERCNGQHRRGGRPWSTSATTPRTQTPPRPSRAVSTRQKRGAGARNTAVASTPWICHFPSPLLFPLPCLGARVFSVGYLRHVSTFHGAGFYMFSISVYWRVSEKTGLLCLAELCTGV